MKDEKVNPILVRYADHPAFRAYGMEDDFEGLGEFHRIDRVIENVFRSSRPLGDEDIEEIFRAEVRPRVLELSKLLHGRMKPEHFFHDVAETSLDELAKVLQKEAIYRNRANLGEARMKVTGSVAAQAKELEERGFFNTRLEGGLLARFWDEIEPWRQQLEVKRSSGPRGQASCVTPIPQEGAHWRTFSRLMRSSGILESVNAYSAFPLDLDYCALQVSHEQEDWWKGCYEDVGLGTSKTAYIHKDQDYSLIKAIIYLRPVTESNSPFTLIPGSHKLEASYSREAFLKCLDDSTHRHLKGAGVQSIYYRPQFHLENYRKEFARLPSVFRGSSHFGDDVLDGTEQSHWLLANEFRVTSDIADCTVFTGGRTLHRGGMVECGERWALQLGFRERDLSLRGSVGRLKRKVKAIMPQRLLSAARSLKAGKR